MRRLIPLLLCLALPLACATLTVASGGPGSAADLAITLALEGAAVSGVSFDVEYDAAALSVRAAAGAAATAAAKTLDANEPSPGRLRVIVIGVNRNRIADGVVAALTVTAKTSAAGAFPLKLSNAAATDEDGTAVALAVLDGRFTTDSSLPRITSVMHQATGQPVIPAGGWVEIRGSGFAASARAWSDADLAGGRLPTRLLGVGVEIGGKPAYIAYISPDRIDALAPAAEDNSDVAVRVLAPQGAGDLFPATLFALAPGFFAGEGDGGKYVLALHADGSPVNAAAPARPGEVVALSGTGFGPTDPRTPEGTLPSVAPLANPAAVSIGGEPAEVRFAGIVAPGRYQLNIVIPESAAAGDREVIAEIAGAKTPPGRYISIAPPPAEEFVAWLPRGI